MQTGGRSSTPAGAPRTARAPLPTKRWAGRATQGGHTKGGPSPILPAPPARPNSGRSAPGQLAAARDLGPARVVSAHPGGAVEASRAKEHVVGPVGADEPVVPDSTLQAGRDRVADRDDVLTAGPNIPPPDRPGPVRGSLALPAIPPGGAPPLPPPSPRPPPPHPQDRHAAPPPAAARRPPPLPLRAANGRAATANPSSPPPSLPPPPPPKKDPPLVVIGRAPSPPSPMRRRGPAPGPGPKPNLVPGAPEPHKTSPDLSRPSAKITSLGAALTPPSRRLHVDVDRARLTIPRPRRRRGGGEVAVPSPPPSTERQHGRAPPATRAPPPAPARRSRVGVPSHARANLVFPVPVPNLAPLGLNVHRSASAGALALGPHARVPAPRADQHPALAPSQSTDRPLTPPGSTRPPPARPPIPLPTPSVSRQTPARLAPPPLPAPPALSPRQAPTGAPRTHPYPYGIGVAPVTRPVTAVRGADAARCRRSGARPRPRRR